MRKTIVFSATLMALAMFLSAAVCFADGAKDAKDRMMSRLPQISDLKAKGVIGEDSKGFLGFVGADKAQQALVEAENADRKVVYEAIAAQTGASPDLVGKRRAQQIAEKAGAGEYIQDQTGKWVKK